jgi:hypothetical protein
MSFAKDFLRNRLSMERKQNEKTLDNSEGKGMLPWTA